MARDQKAKNKAAQTAPKAPKTTVPPNPQTVAETPKMVEETPQATSVAVAAPQERSTTVAAVQPTWPSWPTSKPGPASMPTPAGMRPFSAIRREQVTEIGYNQETGEPSDASPMRPMPDPDLKDAVSFDQKPTGQDTLGKRKKRL